MPSRKRIITVRTNWRVKPVIASTPSVKMPEEVLSNSRWHEVEEATCLSKKPPTMSADDWKAYKKTRCMTCQTIAILWYKHKSEGKPLPKAFKYLKCENRQMKIRELKADDAPEEVTLGDLLFSPI